MTNKNIRLNNPFLLRPAYKDYLWGGNRLNDDFSKDIDVSPLAETWECSTHPSGESIVANGVYEGHSLRDVLKFHKEFLGRHANDEGELPILIKLIDADKDLSVQVHPDDKYAEKYEDGQLGKTEVWYILDARADSTIYYGFNTDVTQDQVRKSIEDGKIEKYLQKVNVKKNDIFYIEAGTVHAIGKGTLVAEIQENSDLTYRLYDYNRTDKHGQKRQLHIDKAMDVLNYNKANEPVQPMRVLRYTAGCAREMLYRCKYFELYRMIINTERQRQLVKYSSDKKSYSVLLCVDGCGAISYGLDKEFLVFKGDCVFVPANSVEIRIHGQMQILEIRG